MKKDIKELWEKTKNIKLPYSWLSCRTDLGFTWMNQPEKFWNIIAEMFPYRGTWSPYKNKEQYFSDGEKQFREYAKKYIDNIDKKCAVDLGVGGGRTLVPLVKRFKKVYAVDISQELLKIAVENMYKKGYDVIPSQVVDGKIKNIPDNSVSFIHSVTVFQHIYAEEAKQSLRKESYRILDNKNGYVCIDEMVTVTQEEKIKTIYALIGFKDIDIMRQNKQSVFIWAKK